jgi:hypothetical protein
MAGSRCLFCLHPNPEGAKFCNDCGSPMELQPCRVCNAVDKRSASHCYQCGAAFPPPLPVPGASDAPEADDAVPATADVPDIPLTVPAAEVRDAHVDERPDVVEPSLVVAEPDAGPPSLVATQFHVSEPPPDVEHETTVLRASRETPIPASRPADRRDVRQRSGTSFLAIVAALCAFAVIAAAVHRFGGDAALPVASSAVTAPEGTTTVTIGPSQTLATGAASEAPATEPAADPPAKTAAPPPAAPALATPACDPAVAALGLCGRGSR